MQRSRWGPLAALALAAAAVPARAVVKVTPGQEFVYSGTVEWKVSGPNGPAQTITAPAQLSALVTEADPAKGYAVILMRRVEPAQKPGQPGSPAEIGVNTVRYGIDLKATAPPGFLAGPLTAALQVLRVPISPREELKTGQEWRQSETLAALPPNPVEMVYTVVGEDKAGDRPCVKIDKKLTQPLPYRRPLGENTLEVTDYGQTLCVDPQTGVVLSNQLRQSVRRIGGGQQVTLDLTAALTLRETHELPADEVASRVKQAAAIDRVQRALFSPQPGTDRKAAMAAATKDVAALRRDYPNSPYTPAVARLETMLTSVRERAEREARLEGLKGSPAPAFTLKNLAGKEQTLAAYRGKIILLNFFASW